MQHFNITFGLLWGYSIDLPPNDESGSSENRACPKPNSLFHSQNHWKLILQFWSSCFAMASNLRINLILKGGSKLYQAEISNYQVPGNFMQSIFLSDIYQHLQYNLGNIVEWEMLALCGNSYNILVIYSTEKFSG